MKLASYKSTRPGLQGVANRIIRLRLGGIYSHNEIVFEPGDDVGDLMHDGSCEPDGAGQLWAASSVAVERMPAHSPQRAGKVGGVRFKRVAFDPAKWDLVPLPGDARLAAEFVRRFEGARYDWSLIVKYAAWFVSEQSARFTCSEFVAAAAQFPEAWRFDPCTLTAAVRRLGLT